MFYYFLFTHIMVFEITINVVGVGGGKVYNGTTGMAEVS